MVGDFVHVEPAAELMRIMRDDYEKALMSRSAEIARLAQRVAELEALHDVRGLGALALAESRGQVIASLIDERIALGRRIFDLEEKLSATLTTIDAAIGDGRVYADGCKP